MVKPDPEPVSECAVNVPFAALGRAFYDGKSKTGTKNVAPRKSHAATMQRRKSSKDVSPNPWRHIHLIGAFDFEQAESLIDVDALAARFSDPDFWNRSFQEAPELLLG